MYVNASNFSWELEKKFPEFFELMHQCLELAKIITTNFHENFSGTDTPDLYRKILALNYYKAINAFVSVTKLTDAGLIGDSQTISRKLIEQAINLKYLSMDIDNRHEQYWNFMTLKLDNRIAATNDVKCYPKALKTKMKSHAKETSKKLETLKSLYETDTKGNIKKHFISKSWSGLNTREMAEKCEMEEDYHYCFNLFSIPTHASSEDLMNFVDPDTLEMGPNYRVGLSFKVVMETVRVFLITSELVIEAFQMKLDGSLKQVRKMHNSLAKSELLESKAKVTGLK